MSGISILTLIGVIINYSSNLLIILILRNFFPQKNKLSSSEEKKNILYGQSSPPSRRANVRTSRAEAANLQAENETTASNLSPELSSSPGIGRRKVSPKQEMLEKVLAKANCEEMPGDGLTESEDDNLPEEDVPSNVPVDNSKCQRQANDKYYILKLLGMVLCVAAALCASLVAQNASGPVSHKKSQRTSDEISSFVKSSLKELYALSHQEKDLW